MIKHKNALGTFVDIHQIESALEQLKSAGVQMSNVSVIVPQSNSEDLQLAQLTEPEVKSEHEFTGDRPVTQIEQVAVKGGSVGTVVGGVVAALTTLA
jgi:S-adenosylmethionine:tRNA-ribosyltransferase-isomerase (queuine synthetase)